MAKMDAKKIAAWKAAHPVLNMDEDQLAECGPWPSLEVNDFLGYAKGRDMYPKEIVRLVEQLRDEINFAYDGWTRTVLASDPAVLLRNLLDSATGDERYNFTRQFLLDFAKSRAFGVEAPAQEELPPWLKADASGPVGPMPAPPEQPEAPTTEDKHA